MGGYRRLLAVVGVITALVGNTNGLAQVATAATCTSIELKLGFCADGGLDGGEAVIRGDGIIDGGNRGGDGGNGGGNGGDSGQDGSAPPVVDPYLGVCVSGASCLAADIEVSDLASFRPAAPTLEMEPDGWMLIGLPANFMAKTGTHVISGTLLGYPLDVRFTPSSYAWSWGDGTASRSTVPGASWASLGLPEFSPTPTSHIFDTKGVYRISVIVSYTVEFRIDSLPWRSISGTLPGPATVVAAVAGNAKTVLVERECTRNPDGPGC
jgi:hypothetical protein